MRPDFINCKRHGLVFDFYSWGVCDVRGTKRYKCKICAESAKHNFIRRKNNMSFTAQVQEVNDRELENHDVFFFDQKGNKQIGYAYLCKKDKKVGLVRCPQCKRENYVSSILRGKCAWCKFDAVDFLSKNHVSNESVKQHKEETKVTTSKIKSANPVIGLSTITPQFEWEQVGTNNRARYTSRFNDRIAIRKKKNDLTRKTGSTYSATVTVGADIAALFGLAKGSKINFYRDKNHPNLFLLQKKDTGTYTLSQSNGAKSFTFSPTLMMDIQNMSDNTTHFVKFDVHGDDGIILDMNYIEQA